MGMKTGFEMFLFPEKMEIQNLAQCSLYSYKIPDNNNYNFIISATLIALGLDVF